MKSSVRESAMGLACGLILVLCSLFFPARPAQAAHATANSTITNTATLTYQDDLPTTPNTYTVSSTISITVSPVYEGKLQCTSYAQNTFPSAKVYYACNVTNLGNTQNTFTLTPSIGTAGWTAALIVDTNNNDNHESGEATTTSSTGGLDPDGIYKFFVEVTVPGVTTVTDGQIVKATLTVVGTVSAGTDDDPTPVELSTTVKAPALSVEKKVRNFTVSPTGAFQDTCSAKPLEVLEYQLKITNSGSMPARSVKLIEALNANLTYVPNTLFAGSLSSGGAANGPFKTDAPSGDTPCPGEVCAVGNHTAGTITFFIGNAATETTGGTLGATTTVYVYYQAQVK